MSNVPKGLRGHLAAPVHPDMIPVESHVWCEELGPKVPIMSNNETQWRAKVGMIIRMTTGSTVYGTSTGPVSDVDEIGIAIEDPQSMIGIGGHFEQYTFRSAEHGKTLEKGEHPRSGPGDLDLQVMSLRKFVGLAANGNPSVLLNLFTPYEHVLYRTSYGVELLNHREWFVSTRAANPFMGYLNRQVEGLQGKRSGGTRNKGRADIRKKYGYDVKFAMHAVRLGLQGVELLTTGSISLPIAEPNLSYLRDIREGKYTLKHCLDHCDDLVKQIKDLRDHNTTVPRDPNMSAINGWMINAHRRFWCW